MVITGCNRIVLCKGSHLCGPPWGTCARCPGTRDTAPPAAAQLQHCPKTCTSMMGGTSGRSLATCMCMMACCSSLHNHRQHQLLQSEVSSLTMTFGSALVEFVPCKAVCGDRRQHSNGRLWGSSYLWLNLLNSLSALSSLRSSSSRAAWPSRNTCSQYVQSVRTKDKRHVAKMLPCMLRIPVLEQRVKLSRKGDECCDSRAPDV